MNRQSSLYYTKQIVSIEIKINEEDDYYYIYINDKFIKKYKSKMRVYEYLRRNFNIKIMI